MQLSELSLSHFRNYTKETFKFGQKTILIGPNGSGKTNLVEAIRFLSVFKSFRTRHDDECLEFGQEVARLVGQGQDSQDRFKLEYSLTKDKKLAKLNDIKRTTGQLIGWLPTVLFNPADLSLVSEGPAARRRFLDSILAQIDHRYLWSLVSYLRVVRHRNLILREIIHRQASTIELEPWDGQLIEFSHHLTTKRRDFLRFISERIENKYQTISARQETILITPKLSELTHESVEKSRANDLRLGFTTLGPHHDDFQITINNRPLAVFGSRGQWRSVVVALKVIEGDLVYHQTQKHPLYLLDDVFSELDQPHRQSLLSLFEPCQVIFTTADTEHPWSKINSLGIISLGEG